LIHIFAGKTVKEKNVCQVEAKDSTRRW